LTTYVLEKARGAQGDCLVERTQLTAYPSGSVNGRQELRHRITAQRLPEPAVG
jgi:hypothetical protein